MFDNIFAAIEKWMRELLTGMVESNMSTMFTDVNEKTSEIAAQVGRTPQNWNSSVFSMIQNLSESVVVPIAGIIITLVLCYELISMLTERNNLHDVDTWMFFKYFVKAWVAIYLVSNTFTITMAVFDVGQSVVNSASGIINGETAIDKQKFISQIMTSKSPVRACDDVDDTALTYAEIKALATGNPYIKEKMDLDIQVSKLKLMRANHTSQIYSLESDIARRYPAEITAAKERIAGLKADLAVAKPLLEQDKEKFSITVEDRVYTDRKEAGSAILAACAAMKIAKTEGQIADLGGFAISSRFDAFAQTFKLTIKRQSSYTIELGSDPAGNIQRILNALASIEKTLPQVERRLETLQQQLAEAKEEVQRPFPQEAELNEKSARLAELNALLDMDEKGDDAALGMDEEVTDSELPAPKREIERSADSVKRPSILAQLHEKQAERMAEPKPQKKKSHDMEL